MVAAQNAREQSKPLSPRQLSKLIPEKIKGYKLKGDSKASEISIGELRYTLCQRTFVNGNKSVQILLFDYAQAQIMYRQSISKWNAMGTVESDSVSFHRTSDEGMERYESIQPKSKHVKIVMGIHDRFFLNISGDKMELTDLRSIIELFDFKTYPE
jgi:hypothetical protein